MSAAGMRRGDPLMILVSVLAAWVGIRAAAWHEAAYAAFLETARPVAALRSLASASSEGGFGAAPADAPEGARFTPWPRSARRPAEDAQFEALAPGLSPPLGQSAGTRAGLARGSPPDEGGWYRFTLTAPPSPPQEKPSRQGGNWFVSLLRHDDTGPGGNEAPAVPAAAQTARKSRWSGDAWMLTRRDGGSAPPVNAGTVPGVYGANQSGAVLRYALSRQDPHRLAAYGRVTTALNGTVDSEVALGLQGRPVPSFPVVALGEIRVSRQADGIHLRPSVMAVTQLPPFPVGLGAQGDLYLQAGYVAGPYATAFVDGQLHVDRPFARIGKGELRIGGGGWGGAQKGAARLDLGPEASWRFALGRKTAARLSVDYRIKVAGNAEPPSGPALTLAAGF